MSEERNGAPAEEPAEQRHGRHAAPDGAPRDPRIDMSRDPTPGVPDHAAPDDDDR